MLPDGYLNNWVEVLMSKSVSKTRRQSKAAPKFLAEEFCSAQVIYGGSFEVEFLNSLHQCPVCQNVEKLDGTGGICRPSSTLCILIFIDHLKKSKNMSQIEGYCWGLAPCWFPISGVFALLGRTNMIMQYYAILNLFISNHTLNVLQSNATVMSLAAKPKPPPVQSTGDTKQLRFVAPPLPMALCLGHGSCRTEPRPNQLLQVSKFS